MIARFFRISEIILVQCCICQFYWGVWLQHMSKRFEQWLFSMLLLYRIRDGVFGISIPKSRSRHRKIMKLLLKLVTKTCVFHSFQNCINTWCKNCVIWLSDGCLCQNGIKLQFLGVVSFNSSTLAVYCFSSCLILQKLKQYSDWCILCGLSHPSWF